MSFIRSALSPVVKAIATTKAPAAIGPYSQGMRASIGGMSLLYTSGALPLDPVSGKIVEGGIEKQTNRVLDNLTEVLKAGGAGLGDVIKVTIYLQNMDDFNTVNRLYQTHFAPHKPARSTVEVSKMAMGALCEIEAIAIAHPGPESSES